jgi:hypothetical protein
MKVLRSSHHSGLGKGIAGQERIRIGCTAPRKSHNSAEPGVKHAGQQPLQNGKIP